MVRKDRVLTKGKSGAWPGTNGGNSAAKQETTMTHQAVGLVPSEKGAAKQETTMMHQAVGLVPSEKGAAKQETTTVT